MTRPKLTVDKVFILEEIVPYEGSEIIGVFTTPDAAMISQAPRDKWTVITRLGKTGYTTRPDVSDFSEYYLVTEHSVRAR